MNNNYRMALLLMCLLLFGSCMNSTQTQGGISGTVSDAETGEGIPEVTVSLQPGGISTTTDRDGIYTIAGLSYGEYIVSFAASWFTDTTLPEMNIEGNDRIIDCALHSICPVYPPREAVDEYDPRYRVISPEGREIFYTGDKCSVLVTSEPQGNAYVEISVDTGRSFYPLPGRIASFNPSKESLHTFIIPEEFEKVGPDTWNSETQSFDTIKVSLVSDFCLIRLIDYSKKQYYDLSNCYFSIRKR
ncbi:MAG: hypothetical protein GF401_01345 [Chitinivibrionales bacterium]|nr:hypothetical protein [Chitinivibrionales bacterium]